VVFTHLKKFLLSHADESSVESWVSSYGGHHNSRTHPAEDYLDPWVVLLILQAIKRLTKYQIANQVKTGIVEPSNHVNFPSSCTFNLFLQPANEVNVGW
jgi:hypothetical protein